MKNKTFKKSDLKTGMYITLRNGGKYIVMLNVEHSYPDDKDLLIGVNDNKLNGWIKLSTYTEDLLDVDGDKRFDIMEVEKCNHLGWLFNNTAEFISIYKREEKKEMTLKEIEAALGYKIKIIE